MRLFGTSGIRGIANAELTPELALKVGMALASLRGPGPYVLGRDARTTGPFLAMAFSSGIMACGGDVLDLGLLPTGAVAFLTRELRARAGCVVTASHNPPEYNGLKFFRPDSAPLWPEEQREIEEAVGTSSFKLASWDSAGDYRRLDETRRYIDALAGLWEPRRRWRVVLDAGCGSASVVAPEVFRAVGAEVVALNARPDGHFPARSPDPRPDTVGELCSMVRALGADVGFAYDGDADRMVVVDERGSLVPFDVALAAYAAYVVRSRGGGTVITTVEASRSVEEAVEEAGGRVVKTRVGDVAVSMEIARRKAVFGGEPCGAWVLPEVHLCADGILASLAVLRALDEAGLRPSEFFGRVPRFHTVRRKAPCPNELKEPVMEILAGELPGLFKGVRGLVDIDGLRLELEDGWILVRPSGTEPVIRVTAEASRPERAEELAERALGAVKKAVASSGARTS